MTTTDSSYDIFSLYQYPWMAFNFFLAYWFVSSILFILHQKKSETFRQLDETKKRNTITYILQLVITQLAFMFQMYGGMDLLFRGQDTTTPERLNACVLAVNLICGLYIWELVYRINIGLPLLIHHVITIMLIQIGFASFFDTRSLWYFRYGVLLCFFATTEQMSFVALYCYRLNAWKIHQVVLFYIAAAQAFLLKTLVSITLIVYFALGIYEGTFEGTWGRFWKFAFAPLLIILYGAQIYAVYILVTLAQRCKDRENKRERMVKIEASAYSGDIESSTEESDRR